MTNNLQPLALEPLPLGAIRPEGWLAQQLRIQADGLSGHLDEFWPDIAQSGWIGGTAEGWERGPYWLDGVAPLAFSLRDPLLEAKVHHWVDHILRNQHDDGWLGPVRDAAYGNRYQAYDPWPVFVVLKALTQYQEATGSNRVVPAMERFLWRLQALLAERPLFDWGQVRWQDLVLSIHWLYDRTGEPWLLDLAATAHAQGYDWRVHFEDFPWRDRVTLHESSLLSHVVNGAMAIKAPGVWSRQSLSEGDRMAIWHILRTLDTYHGQVTGVFSGDEHYAGRNPSQGTELCAVVEFMYSLEVLLAILGEPRLADRLERIAYNALPAAFSPDMWAHQYDQQVNQVVCRVSEDRIYTTNGPDSNLFGLEPNYGCCTANLSQGWPKLAAHTWMRAPGGGIAAVVLAPSSVHLTVDGAPVSVRCETDYPFSEELSYTVECQKPVRLALLLRIPTWAGRGAAIEMDEGVFSRVMPGAFHRIERTWVGGETVRLTIPMPLSVTRRYRGSVAVEQGPLVYALKIGEEWRQIGGALPHADWEVHPTTAWNYALSIDTLDPLQSIRVERRPVGAQPFSPEGAPIVATVNGRRAPDWQIERNAAGPLPQSPVTSQEPLEELTLIPYGCTNLRIGEFPLLG